MVSMLYRPVVPRRNVWTVASLRSANRKIILEYFFLKDIWRIIFGTVNGTGRIHGATQPVDPSVTYIVPC